MSFSRQPCPVWLFDDLVGNILDDNYYMSFLENTIPYLPQPVYQDDQGLVPWANPLQFHPDGTLPDNLYFEDGAVYRLEIRRGPTQNDPLIRLIENFVAGDSVDPTDIALPIDNQIANPQFAFISFTSPYVIENTGNNSYDIAPGWVLDLESAGAVTVTLNRIAITGSDNLPDGEPTNPSYSLSIEITSGTVTSCKLRQRFDHAPAIWASEGISICFTGKMLNNNAEITVNYVPSDGTETTVVSDTLSSVYQFITGGVQLPPSDSTDTGANGYVDIVFVLPIFGTIFLTNIQAIGSPQASAFPYAQTTVERQLDQLFHVYQDSLLRQSKENLVAGWNFSLNPWSFITTADTTVTNQTQYIADQTILHQETASALKSGRSGGGNNFGLQLTAINGVTANRFALIQYIDYKTLNSCWGQILSSLVRCVLASSHATSTKLKMRLIYRTAGDAIPTISNTEPITGWDADGDLTFATGWTAIAPLNDVAYTLEVVTPGANVNDKTPLPYDQFQLPEPITNTMYLGVVVYITNVLNQTSGTEDAVGFDRISLMQNDYALDYVETYDESLRKCEFYYEKSYENGVLPGTATPTGSIAYPGVGSTSGVSTQMWPNYLTIHYHTVKRAVPTVSIYAQDGTLGSLSARASSGAFTSNTNANYSMSNFTTAISSNVAAYAPSGGALGGPICGGTTAPQVGSMALQYTADARLGL